MTNISQSDGEGLLSPEHVALMLGVKTQTLAAWRTGRGPTIDFVKIGRSVRYSAQAVKKFIASRTVANTVEGRGL